ncbi:hypothetical protein CAEBREN_15094 [Caenorhabditis brenneri]|uniref:Uncharacterized protein n=1 Tax=Caenorhabditis brenneri TaxID=135651 RepID=G0NYP9_CAEBE|nr:hypothetical protein CAEBREN_15094 [Caenorhabditis brenneri]
MAAQKFDHPEHLNKIKELEAQDYVPNNYPTRTSLHMKRHNLDFVEDGQGKAQGTLRNEEICHHSSHQTLSTPFRRKRLLPRDGWTSPGKSL